MWLWLVPWTVVVAGEMHLSVAFAVAFRCTERREDFARVGLETVNVGHGMAVKRIRDVEECAIKRIKPFRCCWVLIADTGERELYRRSPECAGVL